jgi:hypothetical protein
MARGPDRRAPSCRLVALSARGVGWERAEMILSHAGKRSRMTPISALTGAGGGAYISRSSGGCGGCAIVLELRSPVA